MELVLYYIMQSGSLLLSFLILIFVIGLFAYIAMRNFRQSSKFKVMFYGLFLGLKNIDIIKLSLVIMKTFLVFYTTMITNEDMVFISIIMVIIISIIYIILSPKKIVYETTSTFMQVAMLYFIYIINNYTVEVEDTYVIFMIRVSLIVFVMILATYFLLRNIDNVVEFRWNKEFSKKRKEIENAE